MRFKDIRVYRDLWFSVGQDTQTDKFFVSFPVSSGIVDYEEYYEVPKAWAVDSENHIAELAEFAKECRHHLHDNLLLEQPGTNRGAAV